MLYMHLCNLAGNERSSSRSVDLIVPVLSRDDDAVVADVVADVADDENLGRSDASEALVAVSIAKGDNYQSQLCTSLPRWRNLPALILAAAAAESLCVAVWTSWAPWL